MKIIRTLRNTLLQTANLNSPTIPTAEEYFTRIANGATTQTKSHISQGMYVILIHKPRHVRNPNP